MQRSIRYHGLPVPLLFAGSVSMAALLAFVGTDSPDLRLNDEPWDSPDPSTIGDAVDFEIEIGNAGGSTDVEMVVEGFGDAYAIERASVQRPGPREARDACAIDQVAGQVQCRFAELAGGSGLTVDVRAIARLVGEHEITISLTASGEDANADDNSATQVNTVLGADPGAIAPSPEPTRATSSPTAETTATTSAVADRAGDNDDGAAWEVWLVTVGLVLLVGGAGLLLWLRARPS